MNPYAYGFSIHLLNFIGSIIVHELGHIAPQLHYTKKMPSVAFNCSEKKGFGICVTANGPMRVREAVISTAAGPAAGLLFLLLTSRINTAWALSSSMCMLLQLWLSQKDYHTLKVLLGLIHRNNTEAPSTRTAPPKNTPR